MLLEEFVGVQDAIDAVGDPFGVEDVGLLQARVVTEVEHRAQVVQEADQRGLAGLIADAALVAQGFVLGIGDEILIQIFELFLDLEPAFGQFIAYVWQIGNFVW